MSMKKLKYETNKGTIVYWINERKQGRPEIVFLPGLTADHRLFDKQVEFFEERANVFVWDAPGHAASRPFELDFSLEDIACWLHEILLKEKIGRPILVGQSMGGYVSQMFMELYTGECKGFVSIDSAPLQKSYLTSIEIWLLKHMEPVYRLYPWKTLVKSGSSGCAVTDYGRNLMKEMMEVYNSDPKYYCKLTGHGYKILAEAIEANREYKITCPAVLICGQKDQAGSARSYNRKWAEKTCLPIRWIADAGHNSNTDKPDIINEIIREMSEKVIAACGNDCSSCPRYIKKPYTKTEEELARTAKLWYKIGYRDHIVTNEEISCMGCKENTWCRYKVFECASENHIDNCGQCREYPCDTIRECFEGTKTFEPFCKEVCTEEEYEIMKRAFFEKRENLDRESLDCEGHSDIAPKKMV